MISQLDKALYKCQNTGNNNSMWGTNGWVSLHNGQSASLGKALLETKYKEIKTQENLQSLLKCYWFKRW